MKKYRVEAFIIPSITQNAIDSNQIDDVKLAKKLKDQSLNSLEDFEEKNTSEKVNSKVENNEQCSSEFSEVFFEIDEHIYDEIVLPENKEKKEKKNENKNVEYTKAFFKVKEPIYDEPFVGNLASINLKKDNLNYDVPQNKWMLANSKYRRFGIVAPKLPKRSSSLKSITEDIEIFDETFQEICCHGRKNGCLLDNQQPEDISEEIFKENWMMRLNALRKLETLLKDKEVALQFRERLLFKKEKELRILERLVKDKMKQAELYAKRYKKSSSSESITNIERNLESRSSNGSKGHTKSVGSTNSSNFTLKSKSKVQLEKYEKVFHNIHNSRSLLTTDRLSNRIGSVRSRSRPRQKIKYDDLDSTLSADIGDSSFIVTSRKFDPAAFRKPAAFVRSASERRPTVEQQCGTLRLSTLKEKNEDLNGFTDIIEEQMLKKISENILASQNEETKFLNYGLIDEKSSSDITHCDKKRQSTNSNRFSYLNLESISRTIKPKITAKERPISWSEDTDDWLKKKRQAYNLAKNITTENAANKENIDSQKKINKSSKINKTKENSRKKFSIFR